jgi:hypothetical protein
MSKSFKHSREFDRRSESFDDDCENVVVVNLDDIYMPERTLNKLARDHGQIERLRQDYESGRHMVRVVLRPRPGGGYNVEDGRHRVVAAKLARAGVIEAVIIDR